MMKKSGKTGMHNSAKTHAGKTHHPVANRHGDACAWGIAMVKPFAATAAI